GHTSVASPAARAALAAGSEKALPKQTLLEAQSLQPGSRTPQKEQAPGRLCSGQGASSARGAAARPFPG
ncbi:unnamed protein product, partial [Coccothraustes coccothraustes]